MTKNIHVICAKCAEPTKRPIGHWDGVDPETKHRTGGLIFACRNTACEHYAEHERKSDPGVDAANQANDVHPEYMRALLIAKGITMSKAARWIGVGPAELSGWLVGRTPFDKDKYAILLERLSAIPDKPAFEKGGRP